MPIIHHPFAQFDLDADLIRKAKHNGPQIAGEDVMPFMEVLIEQVKASGLDIDRYRVIIEAVPRGVNPSFDPLGEDG